jgi:hypothetical protein
MTTVNIDEARMQYEAVLAAKTAPFAAVLRRTIVERPFALDPGVVATAVDAIHFEYEWDSFLPVACPLNTKSGYCGRGEPLALFSPEEHQLFPDAIDQAQFAALPDADPDEIGDLLSALKTELYVGWFVSVWKAIRNAAPGIRGFLSVHDTVWRTDLDTSEEFRSDSGPIKFF